ncbi:MAG TPA: ATP-binding protein [Oscillatoriaceae cyanobacterium]
MTRSSVAANLLLEEALTCLRHAVPHHACRLYELAPEGDRLLPYAPETAPELPLTPEWHRLSHGQVTAPSPLLVEALGWEASACQILLFPLMEGDRALGLGALSLKAPPEVPLLLAHGRLIGAALAQQAETRASVRRAREMESLCNRISEGVILLDAQGRVAKGNEAALHILGLDVPPAGTPWHTWVRSLADLPEPLAKLESYIARRQDLPTTPYAYAHNGEPRYAEARGVPMPGEDGYALLLRDLSARRRRELELSALYELTSAAIDSESLDQLLTRGLEAVLTCTNLSTGLLIYRNADGSGLHMSQHGMAAGVVEAVRTLGSEHGLTWLYNCLVDDDPSECICGMIRQGLTSCVVLPLHHDDQLCGILLLGSAAYSQLSDDLSRWLHTITSQLMIAVERSLAYASLEAQVDRRTQQLKENQRHLEETIAELKRMDQFKSDFLNNVSHELRTPLSSIIGYGEFLAEGVYGELSDDQQVVLDRLVGNSYQLMELINNLLDLSRIDAGKLLLFREPIELEVLFRQAIAKVQPQAQQKQLTITMSDVPAPVVEVDSGRVVQVLVNLLSNAVKFTPDGGCVELSAAMEDDGVTIRVRDTGIGISDEQLPKLFVRFAQGDSSTTRRFGGTGLGLAIARELIELHGQRIWAESRLGEGSTFTFTLPLWQATPGLLPSVVKQA